MTQQGSQQGSTYKSAFQLLGVTMSLRVAGVARGIIVARLLLPDEFGRFVLAAAVFGLFDVTTNSGVYEALIKSNDSKPAALRTAWTIVVLRGAIVSVALFGSAEWLGGLLGDHSITILLQLLSPTPLIRAMSSLAPVLAQRRVDYRWSARVAAVTQTVNVTTSIGLVWLLDSATGLAIGAVSGALAGVLVSYGAPGFSPALGWRWEYLRPLVSFARWRWLSQVAWYTAAQGDDLVVGRLLGTAPLGVYRIAYTIGNLPTTETTSALVGVTFPALARASEESQSRTFDLYKRYLTLSVGVAGLLAGTLIGVADPLVRVLLGEAWLNAVAPLMIMSIGGFCRSLAASGGALFLAVGRPALDAQMQLTRAIVLIGGLTVLLRLGVVGAAAASTLSTLAMLPVWLNGLRTLGVPPSWALREVARRMPAILTGTLAAWAIAGAAENAVHSLLAGISIASLAWFMVTITIDRPLSQELRIIGQRARGRRFLRSD